MAASIKTRKRSKKAGEEANRLINELNQEPGKAAPDETTAQDEATKKAEAEASADSEQNLDQSSPLEKGAEPAPAGEDWEARFKGLQITYQRDVPELRGQLLVANQSLDSLRSEFTALKEQLDSAPDEQSEKPAELELTAEEIEQYGPGLIEMMKRISQNGSGDLAKQVVGLQQTIAELKAGQDSIVKHTAVSEEDKFFSELDAAVPDWEKINHDPKFHAFLAETVPYTGNERQVFLKQARESFDAKATIQFFTDFKDTVSPGSSQDSEHKPDLEIPENMVTPKNSGGGAPPAEEKKYYTVDEVNRFYKEKAGGKYRGKETEARKLEKDIFAAGNEGRILSNAQADKAYRFSKDD